MSRGAGGTFQENVERINRHLGYLGCRFYKMAQRKRDEEEEGLNKECS
jgi:hypothetical protein